MSRTAIVTGGGTGIGKATVRVLTARGFSVIAAGLERDDDFPQRVRFVQTDVTDAQALAALVDQAKKLHALVNCAGILRHEAEWQPVEFAKVIEINLTAVLAAATAALPKLEATGGAIVNIASMWSYFGSAGAPAYSASKGGIVSLTRSMAVAWGPRGIRVNAVAPGWIETRMSAKAKNDPERGPRIAARIPMGRWAEPSEVATVIAFLLSADASYVNGAILPVDGGYSSA